MHCPNCGLDVVEGSAFCPSCGKPTVAPQTAEAGSAMQPNVASALCYLGGLLTGVIFLALEPYKRSQSIRFHAFQSIFLNVVWVVLYIGVGLVFDILPGVMWSLNVMFHSLLSLVVFLIYLFLMYKAYSGECFKLPVIGDLAERQAQQVNPRTNPSA